MRGVSCSPGFKWFVLLLLPLTLGWKLAVYPDESSKENATQRKIAEFLVRQHFTVAVASESTVTGQPMIRATAPACRLLVAESPVEGWGREVARLDATAADAVFVVYGGRIYAEQPTWLTVSDILWSKFPRALGLKAQARPILTVVATRSCEAERLPWAELG